MSQTVVGPDISAGGSACTFGMNEFEDPLALAVISGLIGASSHITRIISDPCPSTILPPDMVQLYEAAGVTKNVCSLFGQVDPIASILVYVKGTSEANSDPVFVPSIDWTEK